MYRRMAAPTPESHAADPQAAGPLEVYLVHSGGPYFERERTRYWGIPKGIVEEGETPEAAARREFTEETGFPAPVSLIDLGSVTTRHGRMIQTYAGEWAQPGVPPDVKSNTCVVEWPANSGVRIDVPEVDEGRFFPIETARESLGNAQAAFLGRLLEALAP